MLLALGALRGRACCQAAPSTLQTQAALGKGFSTPQGEGFLVVHSQVCDLLAAQDGGCFCVPLHLWGGSSSASPGFGLSELFNSMDVREGFTSTAQPWGCSWCPWSVLLPGKRPWEKPGVCQSRSPAGQHISPSRAKGQEKPAVSFPDKKMMTESKEPLEAGLGSLPKHCRAISPKYQTPNGF